MILAQKRARVLPSPPIPFGSFRRLRHQKDCTGLQHLEAKLRRRLREIAAALPSAPHGATHIR